MNNISTTIYVPKKIKVGFNERNDTYTGKLAYVIYYDEKGKLRKERSWESWRDTNIEPEEYNNEPTSGFVLNKKVGDYAGDWGEHRQAYCRIYDPRGFEFEITINNLLFILEHCTCCPGKGLEGDFVYGWDGKDLVLLPTNSPDYIEIEEYSQTLNNRKKFKGKDLILGATYLTNKNKKWIYMGRFDSYTRMWRSYHDEYAGYGRWKYRYENDGKRYWFIDVEQTKEDYPDFERIKAVGDKIIAVISEECDQKYSEYYEKMECTEEFSPIDSSKDTPTLYEYEVFKKDVASLIKQYKDYSVRYGWKCASKGYYNATYLNNKDIHLYYGILNQNSAEPTLYVTKRGSSDITIVHSIEDAYQIIKPMYLKRYLENGKELADKYNYY